MTDTPKVSPGMQRLLDDVEDAAHDVNKNLPSGFYDPFHALTAAIAHLEARNAELKADAKRLDFISDPNHKVQFNWGVSKLRWTIFGLKHLPYGETLREALDSAMKPTPETP